MNGHPPAAPAPAAPTASNGQEPVRRPRPRPKKDSGPLRAPRRPLKSITRPMVSLTKMNETRKPAAGPSTTTDNRNEMDALRQQFISQGATSFPLVVTRRDLKELRHHVMRLQSKGPVDIQDKEQFTPPIRLHRRDPRAPPSGVGSHFEEEETKEDLEEIKDRERMELQKEDRRRIREENQAKIAPTGKTKPQAFQKKTEQKYRPDDTPEAKKRQLLRYEETLPWHLEDFENKQTWVGTYESELSEAHVMLSTDPANPHGAVYMAPMERWYRFNVKGKVRPTGDDLDKVMYKVENVPGFLRNIEARAVKRELEHEQSRTRFGLSTRVGGGEDDEGRIRRRVNDGGGGFVKREADADDIDFNLDEDFADDEEGLNGLFEGEAEDVKEAEEKLKRDQLNAALWDRQDESELARREEQEKKEAEDMKAMEKIYRKSLAKREKQYDYIDSDQENPYLTASESDTDSETERLRAKEEEDKKALEANGKAPEGGNIPSGASSKGTNTPSGSHKPVDIKSKKRPGSPNLSEASGNESSRKKHKKNRDKLADGSRKSSLANFKGAASGSDSEMTDAGKVKKLKKHKSKLVIGASPSGSPGASRAASPAASSQLNGSRAASPAASPKPTIPSAKEIYEALPSQGMNIQTLIVKFKGRVDKTNSQLFIRLVKAVSSFDKKNSWLTPLPQMPSEEYINNFMNAAKQPNPAIA
jgi:transcription initiation factor TFIIF subunit alpha